MFIKKVITMKKILPLFISSFLLSSVAMADNVVDANVTPSLSTAAVDKATISNADGADAVVTLPAISSAGVSADEHNVVADKDDEKSFAASEDQSITLSKNMTVSSMSKHHVDAALSYQIDVNYPQIKGKDLSVASKHFNQEVEKMVNDEVTHFKKLVALDAPHMKTLPENIRKNSLKIDYDIDVIKPKTGTIVSVRLSSEGMQAGRAHPYHSNRAVNFDLATGKMLSLNDLFKKNSKFLQLIAEYSNKSLNQKLKKDNWMVAQGTKADVKNFKNWNLQADSLLITFDEYQVAPYVYGKQEVEVPYSELKKVLANQAPISDCATSSASCQG
jgi:hypothetical protein